MKGRKEKAGAGKRRKKRGAKRAKEARKDRHEKRGAKREVPKTIRKERRKERGAKSAKGRGGIPLLVFRSSGVERGESWGDDT